MLMPVPTQQPDKLHDQAPQSIPFQALPQIGELLMAHLRFRGSAREDQSHGLIGRVESGMLTQRCKPPLAHR